MNDLRCGNCGQTVPESQFQCPRCGAVIKRGSSLKAAQKHFLIWFVLLTLFCLLVALWLPR